MSPRCSYCAVLALLSAVPLVDLVVTVPSVVTAMHVLTTAALVAVALWTGLSYADLGLSRDALRHGGTWALGCVLLAGAVYAVLVTLPWTRVAFLDARYRYDVGQALVVALTTVPLRTVVLEEFAFRGVLWALVRRSHGPGPATVVSAALFGLWHLASAVSFAESNPLVSRRDIHPVAVVAATVLITAVAGALLCELRRRSGSLAAPVALHWAVNGFALVTTAIVHAYSGE